ncbi:MAG: DUF5672 family protein [Bacteroidales bacterium]
MKEVAVIIPIYKSEFSENEKVSFINITTILSHHPIIIIKPKNLNLDSLLSSYPQINVESFDNDYFEGREGYNKLMLDSKFYQRFEEKYKYILIAQLDTYFFKDELLYWCSMNYDYIGAPWLLHPKYELYFFKFFSWLKYHYCKHLKKPNSQNLRNKVGNGGLSLRKIKSCRQICEIQKNIISAYLKETHHMFHEDVFFALETSCNSIDFHIPHFKKALKFSFDKYPKLSLKVNDGKLPFGCHAWYSRKNKSFWKKYIK